MLLWCQQYISFTKYLNIPYMFLNVLPEIFVVTQVWYNMHYTTAKVIRLFQVQYIMKMLMEARVYWNGHIKMFWTFIHCSLLKCLIHLDWSYVVLLQITYPPCISPTQVIALLLAPPLPRLTYIVVWPVAIYHISGYILCIHMLFWWKDSWHMWVERYQVLHRIQPGITGHKGNKCNNVMCNTCIWYTLAGRYTNILCSSLHFLFWKKFIIILVVIQI